MLCWCLYELHIENVDDVCFALANLELLDEGLQENFNWDRWKFSKNILEVSQDIFPEVSNFVIFDEQKCYFFVQNWGKRIFLSCKMDQQGE